MPNLSIQRWVPDRWDEIAGNQWVREQLFRLVVDVRKSIAETGTVPASAYLTLMVVGSRRTGKSSLVTLMLRSLVCRTPKPDMSPCLHTCAVCRQWPELLSLSGLWSRLSFGTQDMPIDVHAIDSTKIQNAGHLREITERIREWNDGLTVAFFDEAHRLRGIKGEDALLRDMETRNVLWLFATGQEMELSATFRDRCVILQTSLPTHKDLRAWVSRRCVAWGIPYEDAAIERAVLKSGRKPGLCIPLLTMAATNKGGLTLDLVEDKWLVLPD